MTLRSFLAATAALMAMITAPVAQTEAPADFQPTEDGVYAAFETSMGDFTAVLFEEQSPVTVANFIGLATGATPWRPVDKTSPALRTLTQELISAGNIRTRAELNAALAENYDDVFDLVEDTPFFDNTVYHRVIPGFMIQGGAPSTVRHGSSGPGFSIDDEFHPSLTHDRPGLLSMANAGPNTGGSQYFVTVAPTPHLNGRHAIFGEVINGYDIVEAISLVERDAGDKPLTDVVVESVKIIRIGDAPVAAAVLEESHSEESDEESHGEESSEDHAEESSHEHVEGESHE